MAHTAPVAQDPWVQGFREQALSGALVPPEGVSAWIHRQAFKDKENDARVWGEFPVELIDHAGGSWWIADPDMRIQQRACKLLTWTVPGRDFVIDEDAPTFYGGVLHDLRRASERLAAHTTWNTGEVTYFVLTGIAPEMLQAIARIVPRQYGSLDVSLIELKVRPTASAAEVAMLYRAVRGDLTRYQPAPRVRRAKRPLGTLVEFINERAHLTWSERHKEWNRAHPDHAYGAATNMQRDFRRALRQVSGEGNHG